MAKTALIVDDSASARLILKRILAEQHLKVDTATSGEEALAYLREARPDVVFMDYLMPGMDGFEALKIIKGNPATATIPVMMYTAQEGELYVGQARALGAFGVLPKQVEPVEIANVLKALHLVPENIADPESSAGPQRAAVREHVDTESVFSEDPDAARIRKLLAELFDQQRLALQLDIRQAYQRLAERVAQIEQARDLEDSNSLLGPFAQVATLAAALVAVVFGYLYFDTRAELVQTQQRATLNAASAGQLAPATVTVGVEPQGPAMSPAILGLVQRAAKLGGSYPFASVALDAERAERLRDFMRDLRGLGFTGTLVAHVHLGQYCLSFGDGGGMLAPPPEQPIERCEQFGWPAAEALSLGERQTLQFANTMAVAQHDETIAFEVVSHGSSAPRIPYPAFSEALTAGEWNEIAAQNQRVEVTLLPE